MALRGIQEYIARDVNNIARVEDKGNIVSIEGNIFCIPRKRAIQYYYYYSYMALCVILLHVSNDRGTAGCHFVIARKPKLVGRRNSN